MFLFDGIKKILTPIEKNKSIEDKPVFKKKEYTNYIKDKKNNDNHYEKKEFKPFNEFGYVAFINNFNCLSIKQKNKTKKIIINLSCFTDNDIKNNNILQKELKNYYYQCIIKKAIYFKSTGKKEVLEDGQEIYIYDVFLDKEMSHPLVYKDMFEKKNIIKNKI